MLLSEKRIMTPEMLPNSNLWSILQRNWDTGYVEWMGLVLCCLQFKVIGPMQIDSLPMLLKSKLVMLLNLDNEGGIALFDINPRALGHLGLEVSSSANVKNYLKLYRPAVKG